MLIMLIFYQLLNIQCEIFFIFIEFFYYCVITVLSCYFYNALKSFQLFYFWQIALMPLFLFRQQEKFKIFLLFCSIKHVRFFYLNNYLFTKNNMYLLEIVFNCFNQINTYYNQQLLFTYSINIIYQFRIIVFYLLGMYYQILILKQICFLIISKNYKKLFTINYLIQKCFSCFKQLLNKRRNCIRQYLLRKLINKQQLIIKQILYDFGRSVEQQNQNSYLLYFICRQSKVHLKFPQKINKKTKDSILTILHSDASTPQLYIQIKNIYYYTQRLIYNQLFLSIVYSNVRVLRLFKGKDSVSCFVALQQKREK
eukprot:TRINITY_DN4456_c0_g2_i1.p1 TRINITY_DN4456_c0_g2~~TRINITY_DN4456_c0_g2_i1.p1  ORF type:complete len:311 (-),score=-21.90 TRINITY_DN4456_c0_g2_i1:949-1881(-)